MIRRRRLCTRRLAQREKREDTKRYGRKGEAVGSEGEVGSSSRFVLDQQSRRGDGISCHRQASNEIMTLNIECTVLYRSQCCTGLN